MINLPLRTDGAGFSKSLCSLLTFSSFTIIVFPFIARHTTAATILHSIRPDQHFEESERARILQKALLQLTDEKRELLVLSRFQELSYAEIAELLGVDAGTVKVRAHRAMKELRDIVRGISSEAKHAL